MNDPDFIVVGSGATGTMAAQTLIESGARVLMLDGGRRNRHYPPLIPDRNFVDLRRTDETQHRYFLGDSFESVMPDAVKTAAQLTPPRQFLIQDVERLLPIDSEDFLPMESLALGGLGGGWGLGCCVFSDTELQAAGLPVESMRSAYQVVASRIGISGAADDAQAYTIDGLLGIQPPTPMDPTAAVVYANYQRKRALFRDSGFYLGRPGLALLTEDMNGRSATALHDMEFYSDAGRAAWRPWIAIERLQEVDRFQYVGNTLVTHFKEEPGGVCVFGLDIETGEAVSHRAPVLVLASGTLGTARIVLRSKYAGGTTLPLLCNAYSYVPCVVPPRVGRTMPAENIGLCQLVLFNDPGGAGDDVAMASLYTYRSLLLFRILRETHLNFADARLIMRYLLSGLIIMGIHHPESPSAGKFVRLDAAPESPTRDRLHIQFRPTGAELQRVAARDKAYMRVMRQMGAWPLTRLRPGNGSSIHYAGTLPFATVEDSLRLSSSGRLGGTRAIYVADGSGFQFLPAKGLTLSLMANAHRVASELVGGP